MKILQNNHADSMITHPQSSSNMTKAKRKGARSMKDISNDILSRLNRGDIESANLVEWLAVDQRLLLKNVLTHLNRAAYLKPILEQMDRLPKQTITTINEAIGTGLLEQIVKNNDEQLFHLISSHSSDAVRCWATYVIARDASLDLNQKLQKMQLFAADAHFGVREMAWLAVRKTIAENLVQCLKILSQWTSHYDENIRRFASESTRPRGVWCVHIDVLKQAPELGLPILEPLKSDPSKYVQNSVGNWLNDASKTQPNFVRHLCSRWESESNSKATKYIIKKARRTIDD